MILNNIITDVIIGVVIILITVVLWRKLWVLIDKKYSFRQKIKNVPIIKKIFNLLLIIFSFSVLFSMHIMIGKVGFDENRFISTLCLGLVTGFILSLNDVIIR